MLLVVLGVLLGGGVVLTLLLVVEELGDSVVLFPARFIAFRILVLSDNPLLVRFCVPSKLVFVFAIKICRIIAV